MRWAPYLLVVATIGGMGCTSRPCREGTLFLTFIYQGQTALSDRVDLALTVGATTRDYRPSHRAGRSEETVEVWFGAGYPRGQVATAEVKAWQGDTLVGAGRFDGVLAEDCQAVTLLVRPLDADGGGDDAWDTGVDGPDRADGSLLPDIAEAGDAATSVDQATLDYIVVPDLVLVDQATLDYIVVPDLVLVDLTALDYIIAPDQTSVIDLLGTDLVGVVVPPSCAASASATTCGPAGADDCCASLPVPGGTFYRSYDGVSANYSTLIPGNQATVSGFRLDRYEVTVGRFRTWAAVGFPRPVQGAGARTLNGMANQGGWDTSWNSSVVNAPQSLECNSTGVTWTDVVAGNESKPINCINWYDAFAFCVWDGGHLATEAEWNFAAAGGNEQRAYPWSSPPMSTVINSNYAVYSAPGAARVGSKSPLGDGKWGHSDLAGNLVEWVLDSWDAPSSPYNTYPGTPSCVDCAYLGDETSPLLRGGHFGDGSAGSAQLASYRWGNVGASLRYAGAGIRCAR